MAYTTPMPSAEAPKESCVVSLYEYIAVRQGLKNFYRRRPSSLLQDVSVDRLEQKEEIPIYN